MMSTSESSNEFRPSGDPSDSRPPKALSNTGLTGNQVGSLIESVARINADVHRRLLLGFLVGAMLLVGMGSLSLVVITRMSDRVDDIIRMQEQVDRSRQMLRGITVQSHNRAMALLTLDDVNNERVERQKGTFLENLDAVETLSPKTLASYSPAIREANDRFAVAGAGVVSLYEAGRIQEAFEKHLGEEHPISHEIESEIRELIGESKGQMEFSLDAFNSDQRFLIGAVIALMGVGVVVAAFVGVMLSRGVGRRDRSERHLQNALHNQVNELLLSRERIVTAEESLRRKIAELLHGTVQTRLLVAWHRLGQCQQMLASNSSEAETLLKDIRQDIDQIREQEVRQASHMLHPSVINVGLLPAIRSLTDSYGDALRVELSVDPELTKLDDPLNNQLPESIRLVVYRVLEEGLNNVYRHAEASSVKIRLDLENRSEMSITVSDDGKGFESENVTPGLGLTSIADRIETVGGSWGISSHIGQGTALTFRLPLAGRGASAMAAG